MATVHSDAAEHGGAPLLPRAERALVRWPQIVLGGAVALLVALPVAARLAADHQPIRPRVPVPQLASLTSGRTGTVAPLPRFSTPAAQAALGGATTVGAVHGLVLALAQPLLGRERTAALWGVVTRRTLLGDQAVELALPPGTSVPNPAYPFRYPPLRPIIGDLPRSLSASQIDRLNDVGALLTLAAARFPPLGPVENAAAVAYALLDRARVTGACAPQENLALLVASDSLIREAPAEQELQRAERVCPGDPTPMWLQGQFEAQQAIVTSSSFIGPHSGPDASASYRLARPFVTFQRLQHAFPRLAAGWAGAADTEMRIGYQTEALQPFSARRRFTRALALYRRGEGLQPGPDMLHGEARALAALGELQAAVAVERRAVVRAHRPAEFQPWLIEDLERLQRFSLAAGVAGELIGRREPVGQGLYPAVPAAGVAEVDPIITEDFDRPFSTGSDELTPATLHVGPSPGGASGILFDLDFIPIYRPVAGLGGESRWCPDWSRRLDLLLAGQPSRTLSGFPSTFHDLRSGDRCGEGWGGGNVADFGDTGFTPGTDELVALAELDLGNVAAARAWAKAWGVSLSQVEDDYQNVWRYGRNFERADAATTQWATLLPNDPLALIRKGEIAFLRARYEEAVLAFQAAVQPARRTAGLWSHDEALALLDEGAALAREGRRAEAISAFAAADTTAADWLSAFSRRSSDPDATNWPPYISYTAQVQAGDAELAARDYERSTEAYRAASDDQHRVASPPAPPIQAGVLANNRAIAELKNGNPTEAVTLARLAVAGDPANPIFHSTEAWALQRLGRWHAAVAEYRVAVGLDPTEYPAENDLGVLLMEHHQYGDAVATLRRAVGAKPGYALGWFNLGVALGHMGPLHFAASQGSLGRAAELDLRLQHHAPTPVFDDVPYKTNLDLSKPLPAHWTFADSQRQAPIAAAGLAALLLLGLALARAVAPAAIPGGAERWLAVLDSSLARVVWPRRIRNPLFALAVTVAVFIWPLHRQATGGWLPVLAFVAGLVVLATVAIQVRVLAARRAQERARQETWLPGLVLGVAAAVGGLAWAPLPVARAAGEEHEHESEEHEGEPADSPGRDLANLHWAAPAALGALALVQLLLAAWLDVPLSRALGAAALVMTASLLTPIKPLDGGTIATTPSGAMTITAIAGTAVLVLLGVL